MKKIERDEFIRIKGTRYLISPAPVLARMSWEDSIRYLHDSGLKMPKISDFMAFYSDVINSKAGRSSLTTGSGRTLRDPEVDQIYRFLTNIQHIVYIHLDALFVEGKDSPLYLETDHRVEKRLVVGDRFRLEEYLEAASPAENTLVSFVFNSQGLPTRKSIYNLYTPGRNMTFNPPQEAGSTAAFVLNTVEGVALIAGLDCNAVKDHPERFLPDYSKYFLSYAMMQEKG